MSWYLFDVDLTWLFLPAVIFVAEMCVVTLGTIRIIFVSRGMKFLAPTLGFFEVMTWLFAISQVMQNLSNPACFIAFAGGFTMGNFFGILIEKKLALGSVLVRIITPRDPNRLIDRLRTADYGVTSVEGEGANGRVCVIFTVVKRRELGNVVSLIQTFDPKTFYSVDELQTVTEGIFPERRPQLQEAIINPLRLLRATR
jgi:uncharacterized protein YebE (UPF0316 family)